MNMINDDYTNDVLELSNLMMQMSNDAVGVAKAVVEMQKAIETIMANQNNLNARLRALEERQDPTRHNACSDL